MIGFIEQNLDLLESFRRKQLSKLIIQIKDGILTTINSDKFNPRLQAFLNNMNQEGEPFTEFSDEPAQVSQIKKVINALYHLELTLKDVETVNLRSGSTKTQDVRTLWEHTLHHTYKAGFYLTHMDVNVKEMFSGELAALAPVMKQLYSYSETFAQEKSIFLSQLPKDIPSKVGIVAGIAVDQMQPEGGTMDFEFLTQFTAVIPSHLDKLRQYIQGFSAKMSAHEPSIDKRTLEMLQNEALQLLHSLESVQGSSFLLPLKVLQYVHIIRHATTLTLSIVDQIKNVGTTSQETVRENLAKLKYEVLPELYGFVDKVEEHSMVTPGTLSGPLHENAEKLYQELLKYAENVVDFSKKGKELTSIEDGVFSRRRLEKTYERMAQHQHTLLKIQEAEHAAAKFFLILKKYNAMRLLDLPQTTRSILATHYKALQPYMAKINPALSNQIIGALTRDKKWSDKFAYNPVDQVANLLNFEEQLQKMMAKERVSAQFQNQLNEDILRAQHLQTTAINLFPYSAEDVFRVDEQAVLKVKADDVRFVFAEQNGCNIVTNLNGLSIEQAWNLYDVHSLQQMKLMDAKDAYGIFMAILQTSQNNVLADLSPETLAQLGHLYAVFQPYVLALSPTLIGPAKDKKIVAALMGKSSATVLELVAALTPIAAELAMVDQHISQRLQQVSDVIQTITYRENQKKEFVLDPQSARSQYVIKHTEHSQAVKKLQASVENLTQMFAPEIRAQLKPAAAGVPYPEAEKFYTALEVGQQVLALKRLFNCLYYLEQASLTFEELRDDSYETMYAKTVIKAGAYLNNAMDMAIGIYSDPHFSVIAQDLLHNLRETYDKIQDVRQIYTPEPRNTTEAHSPNTGMLYALNALRILPQQIQTFQDGGELSAEEYAAMRKKCQRTGRDIQRIIDKSNSYFRLFFEIPTVFGLFRELKQQAQDLQAETRELTMQNLTGFRDKLAELVMEADRWEDRLGLTPGLLSQPMKEILDEFYQGFLQPLNLPSPQHVELVTDMSSLDKRMSIAKQQIDKSKELEFELIAKQELLENLMHRLQEFKRNQGAEDIDHYRDALLKIYKIALPVLCESKQHINENNLPWEPDNTSELDDILNTVAPTSPFSHIERLTKAAISYYKGSVQTEQLRQKLMADKLEYLEEQAKNQVELNEQFIQKYTENCYQRNIKRIAVGNFGLVHNAAEYRELLLAFLQSKHAEIVNTAATSQDISKKIKFAMKKQLIVFERANYQQFYQLEKIKAAITSLQAYVTEAQKAIQEERSTFESARTLRPKIEWLRQLEQHANDNSKTVAQRISDIKGIAEDVRFDGQMLAYQHFEPLTLGWLKQCLVSILEVLGLYTQERRQCLNQIIKAAKEPRLANPAPGRLGIFSEKGRAYDLPLDEEEEPEGNPSP
jgi:hypothetical protein